MYNMILYISVNIMITLLW